MDRVLLQGAKIEREAESAEEQYRQDLASWEATRDAHELERTEIEKAFRLAAKGFSAQMERALDYVLSGIAWPKETLVEYEFTQDVTGVALDVDLPDEGDIPQRTAEARGNGKLSFKNRSDAQVRRDFVALCYGLCFEWWERFSHCCRRYRRFSCRAISSATMRLQVQWMTTTCSLSW
jgi:hypothetical protein